jgi:hypothetical protein
MELSTSIGIFLEKLGTEVMVSYVTKDRLTTWRDICKPIIYVQINCKDLRHYGM